MTGRRIRRLHKVRFRRRNNPDRHLPQFSIDNITPDNARLDHLAIYYPNIAIQYRANEAERFQQYKLDLKSSPLFNSNMRGIRHLYFSDDYVLGGAKVSVKKTLELDDYRLAELPMRIQYNPTRFFANLTPEILAAGQADEDDLLRKNKPYLKELHDYALDAKDNYLTRETWEVSGDLEESLSLYLSATRELFAQHFNGQDYQALIEENLAHSPGTTTAVRDSNGFLNEAHIIDPEIPIIPILDWSKWQVYRTEIYWDFYHESAVEFVKSIGAQVFRLSKRIFTYSRSFEIEDESQHSRIMNAQIVSVELKENVKLVIYAKTPTRIRFEVRYLQKKLDELITMPRSGQRIDNRRTEHIPLLLRYAIDDATKRFRSFASAIRFDEPSYSLKASPSRMVEFFGALHDACEGNHKLMTSILTSLCGMGSVTAERGTKTHKAIKELRSGNGGKPYLIPTKGQREVYEAAPEYQPILHQMVAQRVRRRPAPEKR
jgi:hypothetical protein